MGRNTGGPAGTDKGETGVMLGEDTVDVLGSEGETGERLEGEPHAYFYRMLRSCVSMK